MQSQRAIAKAFSVESPLYSGEFTRILRKTMYSKYGAKPLLCEQYSQGPPDFQKWYRKTDTYVINLWIRVMYYKSSRFSGHIKTNFSNNNLRIISNFKHHTIYNYPRHHISVILTLLRFFIGIRSFKGNFYQIFQRELLTVFWGLITVKHFPTNCFRWVSSSLANGQRGHSNKRLYKTIFAKLVVYKYLFKMCVKLL